LRAILTTVSGYKSFIRIETSSGMKWRRSESFSSSSLAFRCVWLTQLPACLPMLFGPKELYVCLTQWLNMENFAWIQDGRICVSHPVEFGPNTAKLLPRCLPILHSIIGILEENPFLKVNFSLLSLSLSPTMNAFGKYHS
jgi:hypothetical protein